MATIKNIPLITPKAPNLPLAPLQYTAQSLNDLLKTLRLYFNEIDNFSVTIATPASGATTDRPLTNLSVGQFYFDTTLGYPIWYNGTDWVDSSGTVV